MEWFSRYNIRTIVIDFNQTNAFSTANWADAHFQIQSLIKKTEYMDSVNKIIEHVFLPACDHLNLHKTFILKPVFEMIKEVTLKLLKNFYKLIKKNFNTKEIWILESC